VKGMNPEWLAAFVALIVAVCAAIGWGLRWAWRILRRTVHFLDDYGGQPAHDGMEAKPGLMARLTTVEEALAKVVSEMSPNHGQSLRDRVDQTAADVAEIKREQVRVRQQLERTVK
jgi:hypothetical protein